MIIFPAIHLLPGNYCYGQLSWKINGEMGFFRSAVTGLNEDRDILSRLDAQLKYKYQYENREASLNLRVRPELYGFDNALSTIKLKASGSYIQDEENLSWGFNLSTQRQTFNENSGSYYYENFILEGILSFFADSLPLSIRPGYGYQLQNSNPEQDMDIIFVDAGINHYFSSYFEMEYGLYGEYFNIKNRYELWSTKAENTDRGWRIGPQLGLKYLKDFIIDCSYRFIIHNSRETRFLSYEHQIRLLAGKVILPRFSALLLIDYYLRNFRIKNAEGVKLTYDYTPINTENNIYFKLGYDIKDNIEIYTRYGYSKENLFNRDFSLNGWSLLIGIELSN